MKLLAVMLLLSGCSNERKIMKYSKPFLGKETEYYVCKITTPLYKWGSEERYLEFWGESAQDKAIEACNQELGG